MKRIEAKYIKNLEALGVDIKQLWNEKELRSFKRKELIQRVGEEEFKVLETIGRTIREGKWKGKYKTEVLRDRLKEVLGDDFPEEVADFLKEPEVDSLKFHYIKRKYLDGWKLNSPKDLDRLMVEHLKRKESIVYPQGSRYTLYYPDTRIVIVTETPNYRITIYRLKDFFEDYEDYMKKVGGVIFKSWQLEQLLKRLT